MKMTIYLGRTVLKYEDFEKLVFSSEIPDVLFKKFHKLLLRINKLLPDREQRINLIDQSGCLFVFNGNEIIFEKNYLSRYL